MQWISTCVIVCVCAYTIISEILLRRIKLFNDLFQLFETPSRQMSASSFLIIDKVKVSFWRYQFFFMTDLWLTNQVLISS